MKTIRTTDLRDGMRFDKAVYMDGENVFVPAGIPIRQKDIDRLLRWEIREVRTDGSLMEEGSGPAAPGPETGRGADAAAAKSAPDPYVRAIDEYERVATSVAQGEAVERPQADATVGVLLDRIKENRNEMIQVVLMGGRVERTIAAGVVGVTILSAITGMVLKLSGHRLIQLATAAFLHDIGMVKVPKSILKKSDKLTADEMNQIRTHPLYSYRVISKEMKYPEEIGVIALQHHERWDGQGYPRKLRGEDINIAARIIAVADAYVAMINDRPHRDSMIGYSAMKTILNDNGRAFDPKILKAFIESMGIYPIGSIVQLNTSAIGRVVQIHADAPLRPAVELIIDEFGNKRGEREVVNLLDRKETFIVKAVDPKALGAGPGGLT